MLSVQGTASTQYECSLKKNQQGTLSFILPN